MGFANYRTLVSALKLVAMPYEKQIEALPNFVARPDEVALIFDDSYRAAFHIIESSDVSREVVKALDDLNSEFNQMSDNEQFWTLNCLRESVEWSNCRDLARKVLDGLGESVEPPNLDFIQFIK